MTRKGIMALEELETAGEVSTTGLENVNVENSFADVTETHRQMERLDRDMDEAAEVANTLSRVTEQARSSLDEGGLSEAGARAINVAVEHLMRSVGSSRKLNPAFEEFKTNGVKHTQLALEGIGDFIKKILNAIISAVRRVVTWIKSFFVNTKKLEQDLGERAGALEKEVKAAHGKNLKEDAKIDSVQLINFLNAKGTGVLRPDEFSKELDTHTKLMRNVLDVVKKFAVTSTECSKKVMESPNADWVSSAMGEKKKAFSDATQELLRPFFKSANKYSTHRKDILEKYGNRMIVDEYPLIFNNSGFFVVSISSSSNPAGQEDFAKVGTFVEKDEGGGFKIESSEVQPLQMSDAEAVIREVKANLNAMKTFQTEFKATLSKLEEITEIAEAKLRLGFHIVKGAEEAASLSYSLTKVASQSTTKGVASLLMYNCGVLKHSLDYVANSLKLVDA